VSCALKNARLLLPQRNEQLNPLQNQQAVVKSRFSCTVLAGIFNSRNSLVWAEANPHAASVLSHTKNALRSTFWASTVNNFMIWSSLLPPRLSAHIYRVFLEEILPKLLEEILLTLRRNMWFQHYGTSYHSSRQVWEHLAATYKRSLDWMRQDSGLAS